MTTTITAYRITPTYADPYWTGGYSLTDNVRHNVAPETDAEEVKMELDAGCELVNSEGWEPHIFYAPEGWRMSLQDAVNCKLAREV